MADNLKLRTPLTAGGIASIRFFNGRLLTGGDLQREQLALHQRDERLGRLLGEGVAWGLGISKAGGGTRLLDLTPGLAINRQGVALELQVPVVLEFVVAANPLVTGSGVFHTCAGAGQDETIVAGSGLHLLVVRPVTEDQGRAPVVGGDGRADPCTLDRNVEGLEFASIRLSDVAKAVESLPVACQRNAVAHLLLGTLGADPAEPTSGRWGALDTLRQRGELGPAEVPLAVICTDTAGISWVDVWAARRRLTRPAETLDAPPSPTAIAGWTRCLADRARAEGEAAILQFQEQFPSLGATVAGSDVARFLPPAGDLPDQSDWRILLEKSAPAAETALDLGLLRAAIERTLTTDSAMIRTISSPVGTPIIAYDVLVSGPVRVFARAWEGRARIRLEGPALTVAQRAALQIRASSAQSSVVWNVTALNADGSVTSPNLTPGTWSFVAEGPSIFPTSPVSLSVVGGQVAEGTLVYELATGSVLVQVLEEGTGKDVTAKTSVTIGGQDAVFEAMIGRWTRRDLLPGSYPVRGTLGGFGVAQADAVVVGSDEVKVILTLGRESEQPERCVKAKLHAKHLTEHDGDRPSNTRSTYRVGLCMKPEWARTMDLQSGEFRHTPIPYEGAESLSGTYTGSNSTSNTGYLTGNPRPGNAYQDRSKQAKKAIKAMSDRAFDRSGYQAATDLGEQVTAWLAAWRTWIQTVHPSKKARSAVTGAAETLLLLRGAPSLDRLVARTGNDEQWAAVAVFGPVFVPVGVHRQETGITGRATADRILAFDEVTLAILEDYGVRYLDELDALTDEEIPVYFLRDPGDIDPVREEIRAEIVRVQGTTAAFTDDPRVIQRAREAGYDNLVTLANADLDSLAEAVGSTLLAEKLMNQARDVLPESAWRARAGTYAAEDAGRFAELGVESHGDALRKVASDGAREAAETQLVTAARESSTTLGGIHTRTPLKVEVDEGGVRVSAEGLGFSTRSAAETAIRGQVLGLEQLGVRDAARKVGF